MKWRRGRDSNPRYGYPYAAFRVRCIQPLCHLSVELSSARARAAFLANGRRQHKTKRAQPRSRPTVVALAKHKVAGRNVMPKTARLLGAGLLAIAVIIGHGALAG